METFRERVGKGLTPQAVSTKGDIHRTSLHFPEQLPTIKETEQALVDEALKRAKNNQTIAAQMLGLTRSALNKRLSRLSQ